MFFPLLLPYMFILYVVLVIALTLSLISSRQKTLKALKVGMKKLWKITPPFVSVLIGVSVVLYLIPQELISSTLGENQSIIGTLTASLIGSITVMPGPIVYPLCKILVDEGVAYSVIAAFSTTLMMVGILTFPMEKSYFGWKFALIRNLISYGTGIAVALVFALIHGVLV